MDIIFFTAPWWAPPTDMTTIDVRPFFTPYEFLLPSLELRRHARAYDALMADQEPPHWVNNASPLGPLELSTRYRGELNTAYRRAPRIWQDFVAELPAGNICLIHSGFQWDYAETLARGLAALRDAR